MIYSLGISMKTAQNRVKYILERIQNRQGGQEHGERYTEPGRIRQKEKEENQPEEASAEEDYTGNTGSNPCADWIGGSLYLEQIRKDGKD